MNDARVSSLAHAAPHLVDAALVLLLIAWSCVTAYLCDGVSWSRQAWMGGEYAGLFGLSILSGRDWAYRLAAAWLALPLISTALLGGLDAGRESLVPESHAILQLVATTLGAVTVLAAATLRSSLARRLRKSLE